MCVLNIFTKAILLHHKDAFPSFLSSQKLTIVSYKDEYGNCVLTRIESGALHLLLVECIRLQELLFSLLSSCLQPCLLLTAELILHLHLQRWPIERATLGHAVALFDLMATLLSHPKVGMAAYIRTAKLPRAL